MSTRSSASRRLARVRQKDERLIAEHVDQLDGTARARWWQRHVVAADDGPAPAGRRVGESRVEDPAVVRGIDQHAVERLAPLGIGADASGKRGRPILLDFHAQPLLTSLPDSLDAQARRRARQSVGRAEGLVGAEGGRT